MNFERQNTILPFLFFCALKCESITGSAGGIKGLVAGVVLILCNTFVTRKDLYLFNRKSYSRGIAFGSKLVGKG